MRSQHVKGKGFWRRNGQRVCGTRRSVGAGEWGGGTKPGPEANEMHLQLPLAGGQRFSELEGGGGGATPWGSDGVR